MIDWTKPIETMEGWPAKVVSRDYKTVTRTLFLVQIERPFSERTSLSCLGWYQEDGRPWETDRHIRNVPVKREGWMAVYRDKTREGVRDSSPLYDTLEECTKLCGANEVAAYAKVEWEEYP